MAHPWLSYDVTFFLRGKFSSTALAIKDLHVWCSKSIIRDIIIHNTRHNYDNYLAPRFAVLVFWLAKRNNTHCMRTAQRRLGDYTGMHYGQAHFVTYYRFLGSACTSLFGSFRGSQNWRSISILQLKWQVFAAFEGRMFQYWMDKSFCLFIVW
jgi:hypothetical protein